MDSIDWKSYTKIASLDDILNNLHLPWDEIVFAERKDTTVSMVQGTFGIKSDMNSSMNKKMTFNELKSNYDKIDIDHRYLMRNKNLTFEEFRILTSHIENKLLNWHYLSRKTDMKDIQRTLDLYQWNFTYIPYNKHLTFEFVKDNQNRFDLFRLCSYTSDKFNESLICTNDIDLITRMIDKIVSYNTNDKHTYRNTKTLNRIIKSCNNVIDRIALKVNLLNPKSIEGNCDVSSRFLRKYAILISSCKTLYEALPEGSDQRIKGFLSKNKLFFDDIQKISIGLNFQTLSMSVPIKTVYETPDINWNYTNLCEYRCFKDEMKLLVDKLINYPSIRFSILYNVIPYHEGFRTLRGLDETRYDLIRNYTMYDLIGAIDFVPEARFGLPCKVECYHNMHHHFKHFSMQQIQETIKEYDIKMYNMNYNLKYLSQNPDVSLRTLQLLEIGRWEHLHRDVSSYKIHMKAYMDIEIICL
ncbi:hypothetical protein D3C87_1236570 [compost metagenome]